MAKSVTELLEDTARLADFYGAALVSKCLQEALVLKSRSSNTLEIVSLNYSIRLFQEALERHNVHSATQYDIKTGLRKE